jgi:hypothetical protein
LGCFQIAIGCFGGIPSRSDLGLRPLTLGDVTVDQHEPAARNHIAADLNDPSIGPRPFGAEFLIGVFEAAV